MSKLLYVQASPRFERSHSKNVANTFIESWQEYNPESEVTVKPLFELGLPELNDHLLKGKYDIMHGREHTEDVRRAWNTVEEIIAEFASFDKYVFAVPMWNFSIPYKLKHYIDILVQPGYTFGVDDAGGYVGLLSDKKALCIYSRGGIYTPGTQSEQMNHQSPYLEFILGFMGITHVTSLAAEGLLTGPEIREEALMHAMDRAREFAAAF